MARTACDAAADWCLAARDHWRGVDEFALSYQVSSAVDEGKLPAHPIGTAIWCSTSRARVLAQANTSSLRCRAAGQLVAGVPVGPAIDR